MSERLAVFIDEAGDPGVRSGNKSAEDRHEWMCVSAVVLPVSSEPDTVQWVRDLRAVVKNSQGPCLHYARISRERRVELCEAFVKLPVRSFVVATHKSNMREYVNPRIGQMIEGGRFYNWCLRLLLERVTAWAEMWHRLRKVEPQPLQVCFARRGHNYPQFFDYIDKLRGQKAAGELFRPGPGLSEPFLIRDHWSVEKAADIAGLQLADVVASAFYQAANCASPVWDTAPAEALAPVMSRRRRCAANVGVTAWPLPDQAEIPEDSRGIFRHYGYKW